MGGITNFEETGASIEDCEERQYEASQGCLDCVPMGASAIFATSQSICSVRIHFMLLWVRMRPQLIFKAFGSSV